MDPEATAADTPPGDASPGDATSATSSRRARGCAIAVAALVVLVLMGAAAVAEFEKNLTADGRKEQTGRSGSADHPHGAGATARYEDGLRVTVSRPRPHGDGTYSLTVTFENGTGDEVRLGADTFPAPLVVRAGRSGDDDDSGYDMSWPHKDQSTAALVPPLAVGDEREVPIRVTSSRHGIPVTVEITPPGAAYRETAHFQLTLG
ncbi:hypothetical protein [Streptomyces sp. NPDC006267]|uniref:hypothetical protein n=1 Tax=Streptomyces sp. NPDC006267 TaxID=3157173 RepID=UPI0033BD5C0F